MKTKDKSEVETTLKSVDVSMLRNMHSPISTTYMRPAKNLLVLETAAKVVTCNKSVFKWPAVIRSLPKLKHVITDPNPLQFMHLAVD